MNTEHPITPPPELVEQWYKEWLDCRYIGLEGYIATQAARWGADQELEACCEWVHETFKEGFAWCSELRDLRRPKPPSLKQQALALINGCTDPHGDHLDDAALDTIRRALEQLDD